MGFWIIVTIVLLNCVFGIMLDTFALLRDQQGQQRRVLNNQCFICCMERGDFESNAVFNKHCKFEHNLMHYVFYIHYVKHLKSSDRNGMESLLYRLIEENDVSWIPLGTSLQKQRDDEDRGINAQHDSEKVNSWLESEVDRLR